MSRLAQILQMLEESPSEPFLRFALAKEWESQGDIAQALTCWAWFPEHAPEYNGFYFHYVRLLKASGESDKARAILQQGLAVMQAQGDRHAYAELRSLADPTEEEE